MCEMVKPGLGEHSILSDLSPGAKIAKSSGKIALVTIKQALLLFYMYCETNTFILKHTIHLCRVIILKQ